MKRSLSSLLLVFFSIIFVSAQRMSDREIINYVQEQHQQGVSQQKIAEDLLKRGVTPAQLQRVQSNYENSNIADTGKSSESLRVRDNIVEDEIPDEIFGEIKDVAQNRVFGRNIFNNRNLTFAPDVNIPTPMNYILGPGDEVIIQVFGVSEFQERQKISPEGNIYIERLGPIYLNGMTVEEANRYLENRFSNVFAGIDEDKTQIRLTLGQIRTIQVNVFGEVSVPGTYSLSSLSTVFHALYRAGGINNIGSLRTIKLYRGNKEIKTLDVYKYILSGNTEDDVRLQDGDVIVVPPYSNLVDITGKVKRPMFYEMLPGETVTDIIDYAGGFANDAYTENLRLTRQTGEQNRIFTINRQEYNYFGLADGDLIVISGGLETFENRVEIKGAVYREGYFELGKEIHTVSDLIEKAGGLMGDAFWNRAVLIREKDDLTTETIALDLNKVMSAGSTYDLSLRRNDIIYIPSINDIMEDKTVFLHGEVPRPGAYKYSGNTSLEDLIIQAGGLLESASIVRVDVARRIKDPYAQVTDNTLAETYTFSLKDGLIIDGTPGFILQPYDHVYVRKSPGYHVQQNVFVEGEVLFPGAYALNKKTERISDVVARAGYETPSAYLKGARLVRTRSAEELFRTRTALKMASQGGNDSIAVKTLDLDATYSVGIELDKALSMPGSAEDLVLRPGDRLIIPEYENTVKINGAVMYPNTVVYKKNEKLSYYINQAGGYNDNAKKNRTYVIYMNGTVSKIKGGDRNAIQPGCEIIVPTKEPSRRMSLGEVIGITSSVTSMASVVALLINALTK